MARTGLHPSERRETVMRYLLISILVSTLSFAGMFDFMTLKSARQAYERGQYDKAARLYEEVAKEGSDEAKFDAADAYYKMGKYEKALELYRDVKSKNLQFEKLHNMGNCYAKLGKIDEGIKAYEAALKIKEDEDTRFNLELLRKLKKEQKREKEKKTQQKNEKRNNENGNGKQNENKNSGKSKERQQRKQKNRQQQQNQKNQSEQSQKDENRKEASDRKRNETKKRKDQNQKSDGNRENEMKRKMPKEEPISEMELRKWNKVLNRRGIHTLMLPMQTQKGERSEDETTPW
jgi:Ca-activated chloride channel family protein